MHSFKPIHSFYNACNGALRDYGGSYKMKESARGRGAGHENERRGKPGSGKAFDDA